MLASAFERKGGEEERTIKYAIRPTIRQHTVLKRMEIIETVAGVVGDRAQVDLEKYDRLVLVEVYRVSGSTRLCSVEGSCRERNETDSAGGLERAGYECRWARLRES